MAKTTTITTRIDPELKTNVESVFTQLGLTTTQAITLFFKQVEMHQGLPFSVRVFNPTTLQALEESEDYDTLQSFDNLDELFAELEI